MSDFVCTLWMYEDAHVVGQGRRCSLSLSPDRSFAARNSSFSLGDELYFGPSWLLSCLVRTVSVFGSVIQPHGFTSVFVLSNILITITVVSVWGMLPARDNGYLGRWIGLLGRGFGITARHVVGNCSSINAVSRKLFRRLAKSRKAGNETNSFRFLDLVMLVLWQIVTPWRSLFLCCLRQDFRPGAQSVGGYWVIP